MIKVLEERKSQVYTKGKDTFDFACDKHSVAGSVSQRACVFCGSRVVLYPIADALHIVHSSCRMRCIDMGHPRLSFSSGPELHRLSFSTDLRENDIVFGGEKKLYSILNGLIDKYEPKAVFVYATCIIGIIGDDIDAVCRKLEKEKNIPVLSVHSEGFKGTKKDGYRAACDALLKLIGTGSTENISEFSINILGEFNLAGEAWMIKEYYRKIGIEVVSVMTGDGRIEEIKKAHGASLNVVQCSGSMTGLAKSMKEKYGIPYIRVSYFGIEDMSKALYDVADHFSSNPEILIKAKELVTNELSSLLPVLQKYRKIISGKKAAIYVGGAFKAFSLIRALKIVGIDVCVAGSQTGTKDDYTMLKDMCDEGTVILDDSNPLELSKYVLEKNIDLFIGGVKERPIAFKLGIGFCDHNHERKISLAGYEGMLNFIREVHASVMSPVWKFAPRSSLTRSKIISDIDAVSEKTNKCGEGNCLPDACSTCGKM